MTMFRSSLRSNKPYIPTGMSEIWDFLGSMVLSSPTFVDKTGYFPEQNLKSEFFALNEGLKTIRERVGEDRYAQLVELSNRAQAYFEADPEDKDPDNRGRKCLFEMEEILKAARRPSGVPTDPPPRA